jgi:predicted NACHT family NTPase
VFLADTGWPIERSEAYRLTAATLDGSFTPALVDEVQRNRTKLVEFRGWLDSHRTRTTFSGPDDLRARVVQALYSWLERHPDCKPARPGIQDSRPYLEWLRDQTATIDIRGLGEGAGKARNFPIDELYIPLTTAAGADMERPDERKPVGLEEALAHRRLVIVGDPGSGKTTFLRRVAFAMAKEALDGAARPAPSSGWLARLWSALRPAQAKAAAAPPPFPIFIRIAELIAHIESHRSQAGRQECPAPDSSEWLVRFLATRNATFGWGLGAEFFADKLESGEAVVLLDGLDEAPERKKREQAARLFEKATTKYSGSRFVVTTRPQSYTGQALLADFNEARIEPLSPEAVHTFLDRWCRGVYPESRQMAEQHRDELAGALRAVPEIRAMTRNPVMLTALAVVHWTERRLPEQRADLYDAILTWLSRSREQKPGREKAERCLTLLAELAFAMQNDERGRQVRIPLQRGAKALASEFGHAPHEERVRHAADFLEQEMADSGIVVSRGGELQFWHLTFQEYLAAQAYRGPNRGGATETVVR